MANEFSISRFIIQVTFVPAMLLILWCFGLIAFNTVKIGVVGFVVVFGILPFFFKFSTIIQKGIIFLNFIQFPINIDYGAPEKLGVEGARNLYIKYHSSIANRRIRIGVWHILPEKYKNWTAAASEDPTLKDKSDDKGSVKDVVFDNLLAKGDCPVIVYAHGNSNNRGTGHRLELYKVLQDLQYHVIAFDYRSYGDSSWTSVSEIGIVEDAISVYQWALEKVSANERNSQTPIYIWGHSLGCHRSGTGVSSHALAVLAAEISSSSDSQNEVYQLREPNGLILESPFNNMIDELSKHPLGKLFDWLPWFHWMIIQPIEKSNITFKSDEYINGFTTPVMILHAKDDMVVPYALGEKLYETAKANRSPTYGSVKFISFESSEKLGHKYICRAPELAKIVSDFVEMHQANVPRKTIVGKVYLPNIDGERNKIFHAKKP